MDGAFFLIAKLGWALVRPETVLALVLAGAFWSLWVGCVRLARGLVATALAAWVAIGALPLGDAALRALERGYPVPRIEGPVAGIVVLGGAVQPEIAAHWGVPGLNGAGERLWTALALARSHPEAPVLFTGGNGRLWPRGGAEADSAAQVLLAAGLAPERLILEGGSRNTAGNAVETRALRPAREGQWLLVTSAFHMPRSVATFCAAGWTGLTPYPTDFRTAGLWAPVWDPVTRLQMLQMALRERLGMAAYRVTGRAVDPLPPGCLWGR